MPRPSHRAAARHAGRGRWRRRAGRRLGHGHARRRQGLPQHRHGRVSGVWGGRFATSHAFSTLTSLSGEGYIFELCLRTGAFLPTGACASCSASTRRPIRPSTGGSKPRRPRCRPGPDGLLLLPYWSGTMAPFWDPDARGAVVGLGTGHGRGALLARDARGRGPGLRHGLWRHRGRDRRAGAASSLTIGGGAKLGADAPDRGRRDRAPGARSPSTLEASCLGAGMLAASGAGWFASPARPAGAMQGEIDVDRRSRPRARPRAMASCWASTASSTRPCATTFARLAAFAPRRRPHDRVVPRPADHRRCRRRPLSRHPSWAGPCARRIRRIAVADTLDGRRGGAGRRRSTSATGWPWWPTRTPGRSWAGGSRPRCRAPRRACSTTPRPTRPRPTCCRNAPATPTR